MRNIFTPELRTEGSPSYPLGSHQGDKNVMTERPGSWSWAGTQLSSVTQTNWTHWWRDWSPANTGLLSLTAAPS